MSRRTELADAAITTLAREGMRGLTHRAVDRTAGLPEGSTSYYFRSRRALLRAIVERLVEVDAAELPALPTNDLDTLADAATGLVRHWMTTGRDRQLARYELALEATRIPELRDALVSGGARVRAMAAGLLEAAGVADPEARAYDLSALLDGLLFDQIAGAGGRDLTADHLRATIRAFLSAVTEHQI